MNLDTDCERFVELANDNEGPAVVRVVATLEAEVEPLAAYAALMGRTVDAESGAYGFLLESAEKIASSDPDGAFAPAAPETRHARYSFVGYDPAAVLTVSQGETTADVLDDRYAGFVDPMGGGDRDDGGVNDEEDEDESGGGGDVLDRLRAVLSGVDLAGFPDSDRQLLDGGLVGFLAYDAVYDLHLDAVGLTRPNSSVPDAQFVLTTTTLIFDHAPELDVDGPNGSLSLVFTPLVRPGDDPHAIYDDLLAETNRVERTLAEATSSKTGSFEYEDQHVGSREAYEAAVRQAKERVLDGDIYQGVLSRKHTYEGRVDPLGFYEALRSINPSPYMYLLCYGHRTVVGASPETLLSVRGTEIVSNPIAGTCPRGTSPVEDRRLAGEMLADGKERAEHTMLVDLARNDVRRVAEPGSVRVEEFMNVLKYSHVQHIESTVTGRLATDCDAFDATRAAFPAGTLSGAPKIRAMEIIDTLEDDPRGLYGGGVGYYSWGGDADLAIVIRTATIDHDVEGDDEPSGDDRAADRTDRDRITVRAGAGIVADSDPRNEYEETERKMDGVLAALRRIEPEQAPSSKPALESNPGSGTDPGAGTDR